MTVIKIGYDDGSEWFKIVTELDNGHLMLDVMKPSELIGRLRTIALLMQEVPNAIPA